MTKNISACVCVDHDMGIGFEGKLLYRSPTDLAFFCGFTQNKIIVGGRRTMEGIKTLPNRGMVCLTRDPKNIEDFGKYLAVTSIEKFDDIVELGIYSDSDIVVIGGEEIYAKLADKVSDLYMTVLNKHEDERYMADAHFPLSCYRHLDKTEIIFKNDELTVFHSFK